MQGRVTPISDLGAADLAAWRDLAAHALEPNPVFEAACLVPAVRHLPGGEGISLAIAEQDGVWHGCFPVAELEGGAHLSPRLTAVSRRTVTTHVRRTRYDGTPLLRDGDPVGACRALVDAASKYARDRGAGLLLLESVDEDGPVMAGLEAALGAGRRSWIRLKTWERPIARRSESGIYAGEGRGELMSARRQQRLRRWIEARTGSPVETVDRSEDPFIADQLITLESAGYKGREGVALSAHDGEPEWYREMCAEFQAEGRLVVLSLESGGRVIAIQQMIRAGAGVFGMLSAYSEEFSGGSPGTILHYDGIRFFHESTDAAWSDTCTGEGNTTLLAIYPDRRRVSSLVVAVGNHFDSLVLRAVRVVRDAQRRANRPT